MTLAPSTDATGGIWAPLRRCCWPGCPHRQDAAYCPFHARYSPRNHGGRSRQVRGLGAGWPQLKAAVIERDGGRCQLRLAGCTLIATTADHIIPRAVGGSNDVANLRASCVHCNAARRAGS